MPHRGLDSAYLAGDLFSRSVIGDHGEKCPPSTVGPPLLAPRARDVFRGDVGTSTICSPVSGRPRIAKEARTAAVGLAEAGQKSSVRSRRRVRSGRRAGSLSERI